MMRRAAGLALCLVLAVWSSPAHPAGGPSERILDGFEDITPWTAAGSDGVRASVHPAAGPEGRALRLDFDLAGTAGYALARRTLPLDLPPRYELSFDVRAEAPVNTLQVKLIDASGENVWWVNRPDFEFPRTWRRMRITQRQIGFAWGPGKDRTLRHVQTLEIVVAAGRGGGRGSVYVSRLALRRLPDAPPRLPPAVARASSSLPGAAASRALDGDSATAWRSDPAAGPAQALTIDFHGPRELGGLIVRWAAHAYASRYDVQLSDDGARWRTVRRVVGGRGGPDALQLPDAEARFLRLVLHEGPSAGYGLAELELQDAAFGASANVAFQALARASPRGTYPRGFSDEQSYWTVVGLDGGKDSGLLSEDGALEVSRGGFSVEPFVVSGARVIGWADVRTDHGLVDGYLPIPRVVWRHDEWELRVSAFASGTPEASRLVARYDLRNLTGRALRLQLVLAVRPFQVNPPSQALNMAGGVSRIHDIAWDGSRLTVDAERRVVPLRAPDRVGTFPFDAGPVPRLLGTSTWAGPAEVRDPVGYASAALGYDLALAPHGTTTVGIVVPLSSRDGGLPVTGHGPAAAWLDREQAAVAATWRDRLDRVSIDVPASARRLTATLRTALAHLLITRDGPVLRPGTRSYARSWIRDGAMIAESLLRLGHAGVAADYLRWYAPHQFADGKVPCCVDERGADPVPENDSDGELIFLAAELYRYTHDRGLLEEMWPHVEAAVRHLETLRASERTEANLAPARRAFYGLLPASISHEGYAAKPVHSYWDDFWALKGYDGAIAIASALGHGEAAGRFTRQRDEFRRDLAASLRHVARIHGIAYLPGSAELGDFDPASSTIAFAPAGDRQAVPDDLVAPTFERYWREFVDDRKDGGKAWDEYTPYEIRTVGTFVRLGWRERAHELLAFFMAGRRPAAWNQWAEVVGRDPRRPRFVGDMPHGWVASDFIRSVLDLFAYERASDQALVVAAGIPPKWLDGSGVTVRDLRTPHGPLSYSLRKEGAAVVLRVAGGLRRPPGGVVLVWPGPPPPPRNVRINGQAARWNGTELRVDALPATVVVDEAG